MTFHSNCYTARSSGYKYRTLSTNTGLANKQNQEVENPFEKKFKQLRKAIITRVNLEVHKTHKARKLALEKFTKLDDKINSMIDLQNTVTDLQKILQATSVLLVDVNEKVDKIETINSQADLLSQQSRMIFRSQEPIKEENMEDRDSIVTRV